MPAGRKLESPVHTLHVHTYYGIRKLWTVYFETVTILSLKITIVIYTKYLIRTGSGCSTKSSSCHFGVINRTVIVFILDLSILNRKIVEQDIPQYTYSNIYSKRF